MNEGFSIRTNRQTIVRDHYKNIADSGVEFYTCDDDDLDKEYGMYYGNLEFDPLRYYAIVLSGHTKMFHKEKGNEWKQLMTKKIKVKFKLKSTLQKKNLKSLTKRRGLASKNDFVAAANDDDGQQILGF